MKKRTINWLNTYKNDVLLKISNLRNTIDSIPSTTDKEKINKQRELTELERNTLPILEYLLLWTNRIPDEDKK